MLHTECIEKIYQMYPLRGGDVLYKVCLLFSLWCSIFLEVKDWFQKLSKGGDSPTLLRMLWETCKKEFWCRERQKWFLLILISISNNSNILNEVIRWKRLTEDELFCFSKWMASTHRNDFFNMLNFTKLNRCIKIL